MIEAGKSRWRLPSRPIWQVGIGNFTSQDFGIFLRSFFENLPSPQISSTLVGHFTWTNDSLRNSLQSFRRNCAGKRKAPGSRNSPGGDASGKLKRNTVTVRTLGGRCCQILPHDHWTCHDLKLDIYYNDKKMFNNDTNNNSMTINSNSNTYYHYHYDSNI